MTQASKRKQFILSGAALSIIALLAVVAIGFPGNYQQSLSGGVYVYPIMGPRLSSNYGKRKHPVLRVTKHHKGIDLAAPTGALIRAVQAGRVVFADPHGGYGNLIVIMHEQELTSHYGHCESIRVTIGEKVRPGQIIGTVGRTGRVTGPHLHFEIRKNGVPQNPEQFIPDLATRGRG